MNQQQWQGSVGGFFLEWERPPVGVCGVMKVRVREAAGTPKEYNVKWRRDQFGLTVFFPEKIQGYDFNREVSDDGESSWSFRFRNQESSFPALKFSRPGEAAARGAGGGAAKKIKVKSQMPGKIVKFMFEKGATVQKGHPVLVMEAMKMENEIKAPITGKLIEIKVQAGQAVETGAELFMLEPEGA